MSDALLSLRGLSKAFGALKATDDVSLDVAGDEIHVVIGPNGAGKSTLIAQIAGSLKPDSGAVLLNGDDVTRLGVPARARRGLARTFQISSLIPNFSALANVSLAVQSHQGSSFRLWRSASKDSRLREPAQEALSRVGMADTRCDIPVDELSHGERRQVELAVALALRPRLMLLDEPMAGLGGQDCINMTAVLKRLRGECAILLVEHDMDAVFALADRISVLVYGRVIASGTPQEIRASREVQEAYLGN